MVSEVRFRDIISNFSNKELLEKKINTIISKEDLKWTLISKELPLTFDVVGLQFRYCDIVGYDQNKNVYIIELKRNLTTANLKKTEAQVLEYVDLFKDNISYIQNNKSIFYPHFILKRYLEYANLDYNDINDVIPLILSINEAEDSAIEALTVKCGALDVDDIKYLVDNYMASKKANFLKIYEKVLSWYTISVPFKQLVEDVIISENIDTRLWFPIVLHKNRFNTERDYLNSDSRCNYDFSITFENIDNYRKRTIDVTKYFKIQDDDDSDIPEVFFQFKSTEIFEKIHQYLKKTHSKSLEFVIQIYKSGRTNPIIYLQLADDLYVPLIQIKPVVVSIGPCVNRVIAHDMKDHENDENCFYEDVIAFDQGTYEIESNHSEGVLIYSIYLYGNRNNYMFHAYSPKLRSRDELLPYMTPEKVQKHFKLIIKEKGEEYLFKNNREDPTEWITSRIKIK